MTQAVLKKLAVSRETQARLEGYADLLVAWQRIKNLVSPHTIDTLWERHIADCAQIVPHLGEAKTIVDLGTGAGLPGVVIGILCRDVPDFHVHLVESNARKCAFLREAVRVTGACCSVHMVRAEDFVVDYTGACDIVTARAFTSLHGLLDLSASLLKSGAKGLYFKGAHAEDEITQAREFWKFEARMIASHTAENSALIEVTDLQSH